MSSVAGMESVHLREAVGRYARRKARVAIGTHAAWGLVGCLGLLLAALVVDRAVELPPALRAVLPLATVIFPAGVLGRLLIALLRRRDPEVLAGELDARHPSSRDVIRSALNLLRRCGERGEPGGAVNPFLLGQTVRRAEVVSDEVPPAAAAPWGRTPWALAIAAALTAGLVGLACWPAMRMDLLLVRLLDPLGNHPRPSLTRIEVSGPLWRKVPAGDDVAVTVRLTGVVPEHASAMLHVAVVQGDGGAGDAGGGSGGGGAVEQVVEMIPRPGGRFEGELKSLTAPVTMYVTAGDGRSAMYRLETIPRPCVRGPRVRYDYPRYTLLPPLEGPLENRQVKAVVGTRVRLDFESSLPVRESVLAMDASAGRRRLPVRWDRSRTHGSVAFRVERDCTFRLDLTGEEGTDNRHEGVYRVRAVQDNPPTVALTDVPAETSLFREDVLRLSYRGSDDFGIAEAFLRCRQQPRATEAAAKEWSIELPHASARTAAGTVAVDLRELTDELATGLQVQLVMVDTNGEEGSTPPLDLQIISDSADRQLQELLEFQETYGQQLARTVRALRAKVGQLGILIDGLDDNTPLTPKRKEMLKELDRRLGEAPPAPASYSLIRHNQQPLVFRSFPCTEYPYHSLRKTETLLAAWPLLVEVRSTDADLAAIDASPSPKAALTDLRRRLDARLTDANELAGAFSDLTTETRLRALELLADRYLRTAGAGGAGSPPPPLAASRNAATAPASAPATAASASAPAPRRAPPADAALAAERQRETLRAIDALAARLDKQVSDPSITAALESLASARRAGEAAGAAAARPALQTVYDRLLTGPDLDGRLGKRLEAWERSHTPAGELRRSRAAGAGEQYVEAMALLMQLRRDDPVLNDAELFLQVRLLEAMVSGDDGRIAQAAEAAEKLAGWSQRYDLLQRARLLAHGMRTLVEDTSLGRVRAESPQADVRWQAVRELMLSLVRDDGAGRFNDQPAPVRAELARLAALRAPLGGGQWAAVAAAPSASTTTSSTPPSASSSSSAREELLDACAALVRLLAPEVEKDAAGAVEQAGKLLGDLAANLSAEAARVRAEVEAIDRESGPPAPEPADRSAFRAVLKDVQRPTLGRERFSIQHAERMACHAIAMAKVLDILQSLGRDGAGAGQERAAAMNVLAEYLAHLEEETYDQIVAIHKTGYGNPVIFTVAARRFYAEAQGRLAKLGAWAGVLAAGRGEELMKDAEYVGLLRGVNKDARHRAAMDSHAAAAAFLAALAAAKTPEARRQTLWAGAGKDAESPAYWQLVRLAAGELAECVRGVGGGGSMPARSSGGGGSDAAAGPAFREAASPMGPQAGGGGGTGAGEGAGLRLAAAGAAASGPAAGAGDRVTPRARIEEAAGRLRWILPTGDAAPQEVKTMTGLLAELPALLGRVYAGRPAGAAGTDEAMTDWVGRLTGAMQGLEARSARPPLRYRPRLRYQRTQRTDLEHRLGRILRNEYRWSLRVADAQWDVQAGRARALAGQATRDEVRWLTAEEQIARRKSAAAAAQQSRALDLAAEGVDERFLKMPKHLYEELRRALAKPYPTQFKEPALEYMHGLMNDAR